MEEEPVSPLPFIGIIHFLCQGIKLQGIRKMFSTISSAFLKEKGKFIVRHPYFTSEIKQILAHRNSSCRHNSVMGDPDLVLPMSLCIRKYNMTDSDIKCQVRHLSKMKFGPFLFKCSKRNCVLKPSQTAWVLFGSPFPPTKGDLRILTSKQLQRFL